jgi:EAL domain-containing protein (putative c-di-GMP-specific phosphodiesterase class I)
LIESIRSKQLSPGQIQVEVTEGIFMSTASSSVFEACQEMSEAGIQIAFDDFGTGFASLTHLRDFPVDIIKLDRSFVNDISQGGSSAAIIRALIGLGKSMNLKIVAEGIETEEQAAFLRELGCDVAQGYLYAKPLSLEDARSFLVQHMTSRIDQGCSLTDGVKSGLDSL